MFYACFVQYVYLQDEDSEDGEDVELIADTDEEETTEQVNDSTPAASLDDQGQGHSVRESRSEGNLRRQSESFFWRQY